MTEEEEFEFRARRERELAASQQPEPEPAPAPEKYLMNENGTVAGINPQWYAGEGKERDEALAAGARKGAGLSFSDEIQGKVGQLLDDWTGLGEEQAAILGEEYDSEQNYRSLRNAVRAEEERLQEAQPGQFLAGELAGAIATPIPVAKGAGVKRALGRAAAEGAAYGAGGAEELEDIPQAALAGASTATAFTGGLRALGKAGSVIGRERVKQELGRGDDFTPIWLADDNTPGDIYRSFLTRTYGARDPARKMERPFREAAEEAVDVAQTKLDDVTEGLAQAKSRVAPEVKAVERAAAQKQAKKAVSQAIIDTREGQRLWDKIDSEKFEPEEAAAQLRNLWKKQGFKEVKQMKFDVDEDLVRILKKHFPDEDVEESLRRNISGEHLMDMRNEFRIRANRPKADMAGKQAREYAEEIDNWMMNRMEGGQKGIDAQRFQDELTSWGEYQALRRGLKGQDADRFNVTQLAKGRGVRGEEGTDVGQEAARRAKAEVDKLTEARKAAERAEKKAAQRGLKEAKEARTELRKKMTAENPTGLSELLSTSMLGGLTLAGSVLGGPAGAAVAFGSGLGAGRGLMTQGAQRAIAGQTGVQRTMQALGENEKAQLIAELIRRGVSREAAMVAVEGG